MNAVSPRHPIQEAFAFVNLIHQRASTQQMFFRQLADWGLEQIAESKSLFAKIATNAANGRQFLETVADDGIITPEEKAQIDALLAKIEANALEGRS